MGLYIYYITFEAAQPIFDSSEIKTKYLLFFFEEMEYIDYSILRKSIYTIGFTISLCVDFEAAWLWQPGPTEMYPGLIVGEPYKDLIEKTKTRKNLFKFK